MRAQPSSVLWEAFVARAKFDNRHGSDWRRSRLLGGGRPQAGLSGDCGGADAQKGLLRPVVLAATLCRTPHRGSFMQFSGDVAVGEAPPWCLRSVRELLSSRAAGPPTGALGLRSGEVTVCASAEGNSVANALGNASWRHTQECLAQVPGMLRM